VRPAWGGRRGSSGTRALPSSSRPPPPPQSPEDTQHQLVQPLPVSRCHAAAPEDHSIKDGRCHHRVREGLQEGSLHSKGPQPPLQGALLKTFTDIKIRLNSTLLSSDHKSRAQLTSNCFHVIEVRTYAFNPPS